MLPRAQYEYSILDLIIDFHLARKVLICSKRSNDIAAMLAAQLEFINWPGRARYSCLRCRPSSKCIIILRMRMQRSQLIAY